MARFLQLCRMSLKAAKLEYFWLYNLRHTYASRLSAAGVSDLFVTQMIGHSTPSILQEYSKAIDEYRRDAVRKLEQLRAAYTQHSGFVEDFCVELLHFYYSRPS